MRRVPAEDRLDWETNSTILAKLQHADAHTAWSDLDHNFREPIARLARGEGLTDAEAEDIVQETLLTFARSYQSGKYSSERGRLRSWLFGIARTLVRRARTSKAALRQREVEPSGDEEPERAAVDSELEARWEEEWRRWLVERALRLVRAEVSGETFEIFRLRTFEELDSAAVAARLGVPMTKVYNAHSRVMQRLAAIRAALDDA